MVVSALRSVLAFLVVGFTLAGFALAGTPRFAYVPNIDDGTVSQFYVNAATGQLLPNGYVMAGDHPRSFVAVGNHAYVANMNSGDITAYSLSQATGKLTPLTSPTYSAPGSPFAMIAHPNGKFLYVVNSTGGNVYVYQINSDGSLSMLATTAAGTQPRFVAITGSGNFLYVANFGSNNVSAYRVNATTGLLTPVGTYATGGVNPSNVMTSGSFLYVTNAKSNNVSAFVINATTGALAHVAGSPFGTGTSPYALTREFFGHFIYVGNSLSNNISVFKVNQTTGALTKITGSPFAATKGTQALRVSPSNNFLYAADAGAEEVMVYSMNLTTGALTNTSSVRTHGIGFDMYVSNGTALTIAPSIAYVMNNDNNIPFNDFPLATYTINGTSGALTSVASSVDTADIDRLLHDPTGKLLVLESSGFHSGGFTQLCRVQANGACPNQTFTNADLFGNAFDPQGVYAYIGYTDPDLGWQGISGFRLSPSGTFTMTPTPGSPYGFGGEPMGFDLSGKFLYTNFSNSIELLKVNPASGDLTFLNGFSSVSYSPNLHPSGRFLYMTTSGGVLAIGINPANGNLTTLSFTSTAGGTPLIDQSGKFAYLSNGNSIVLYRINKTTGALTKISTVLTTHARAQIDASGNFLYLLLNGTMGSTPTIISSYRINHSTGAITFGASKSFATNSSTGYSLTTIQKVN
jgi:6-phosphogluconolactonase (cycloisomerase 2 family)